MNQLIYQGCYSICQDFRVVDATHVAIGSGSRRATILLDWELFSCARRHRETWTVDYDGIFNLSMPQLPAAKPCLADLRSEITGKGRDAPCIPRGWSHKDWAAYGTGPKLSEEFFKLSWHMPALMRPGLIHPDKDVYLSESELEILKSHKCFEFGKWLGTQLYYCLTKAWGDQDWQSSFNSKTSTWEGGPTPSGDKTFDLRQYVP